MGLHAGEIGFDLLEIWYLPLDLFFCSTIFLGSDQETYANLNQRGLWIFYYFSIKALIQ
jgi:hypothetical protein